jgi:hypothetical protein
MAGEQNPLDYFKELTDKMDEYRKGALSAFFTDIARAITDLDVYGGAINKAFGETRQRIGDIKTALADATPRIDRLGGDLTAAQQAITDIALATKRNVIATTEQTEKLYAAFKVTGVEIRGLVDGFADVGVGVGQMSKQIEGSIQYIQSIGANTKQVFGVVTQNMDQLNRYQFEGGVQGLTKMAAQASLLRYDMNQTFNLADELYKPERAIEVASAFQRLGLAVGDLGDPFRLMDASINDPQGLQDSLVNMTKQFAYFDNQTKTFKMSPEGVLRLKELGKEIGMSSSELVKLGLSAKEADARISAISAVGLNVKEEDKQLLSNISRMGDGGEYEISVKDSATGERRWEKLTSVSQQQLEATLKEQKEGPKSLEDIARSQLDYSEMVAGDVRAIYHGFMYGFASNQTINKEVEGGRKLTDAITSTLSDFYGKTTSGRQMASTAIGDFKQFLKDMNDPNKGLREASATLLENADKQSQKFGSEFKEGVQKAFSQIIGKLENGKSETELGGKKLLEGLMGNSLKPNVDGAKFSTYNALMGGKSDPIDLGSKRFPNKTPGDGLSTTTNTKTTVDVGGKIQVEFTTPNGSELTKKMLDDWANSPQTKQYFMSLTAPQNPTKAPNQTTYGN